MSDPKRNSTGINENSFNKSHATQTSQALLEQHKLKNEGHGEDQRNNEQGLQRQSLASQQEPVNFGSDIEHADFDNAYSGSRRVTIGSINNNQNDKQFGGNLNGSSNLFNSLQGSLSGMNGGLGVMDRRGSMTSLGMDDFLTGFGGGLQSRRGSLAGFDGLGGVDNLFGGVGLRRDSLDSTAATLDAALMDLNRRRLSAALPPFPQDNAGVQSLGLGSFQSLQNNQGLLNNGNAADESLGGMAQQGNVSNSHDSIATRQAQLQAQQRELERKQKQLELERQRLVENIRQRNFGAGGGGGGNSLMNDRNRLAMLEMEKMGMVGRSSFPFNGSDGIMGGNNNLGALGSAQSHLQSGAQSFLHQSGMDQNSNRDAQLGLRRPGGAGSWHICQFCHSKAFASLDEAIVHENSCVENPGKNGYLNNNLNSNLNINLNNNMNNNLNAVSAQNAGLDSALFGARSGGNMYDRQQESMMQPPLSLSGGNFNRRFSLGMDTSQRSTMSFGLSGMLGLDGPGGRGLGMGLGSIGGGMDISQRSALSIGTGLDVSQRSMQSLDESNQSHIETTLSNGPFTMLQNPMPLSMDCDKDWLTPLHCFVRRFCVEVFTATEDDVATPSKGKRKQIHIGQIGIRCPHCRALGLGTSTNSKAHERGSVYYPTAIKSIYNATMNLLQRHLHSCPAVPDEIMRRYETLKSDDARSGTSKRYWEQSALSLGLVDTLNGIRFSALRPPPPPSLSMHQVSDGQNTVSRNSDFMTNNSNRTDTANDASDSNQLQASERSAKDLSEKGEDSALSNSDRSLTELGPLVAPEDKPYSTLFSYHLLGQMKPCVFTEADRLGKRKGLPPGFPGLACRHCFGGYGSGRFFPSSIKTLSDTSKTLNVLHNHMMRCRKCPAEQREKLEKLRGSHDEERAKMKFGSQKAFFARIWERLHGKGFPAQMKRDESASSSKRDISKINQQQSTNNAQGALLDERFENAAFQQQSKSPKPQRSPKLSSKSPKQKPKKVAKPPNFNLSDETGGNEEASDEEVVVNSAKRQKVTSREV